MRSPSGAPEPNADAGYELGDLELAPRAPRATAKKPAKDGPHEGHETALADELTTVSSGRGAAANDFGLGALSRTHDPSQGDDHSHYGDFDADESIELDVPGGDPRRLRHGSSTPPLRASLPLGTSMPMHSSRAPRSLGPEDDERAARQLADFGEPNRGFGAPAYVLRVAHRMFALWSERRRTEQLASGLAVQYEQALRDLGRALLDDTAVLQHEGLRDRLLIVQTKQGELEKAEEATQLVRARHESELVALKKKQAELEAELAPFLDAERKALAAQAKVEAELKRQKAKLQRADIELRALSRATIPPPPERVQGIESERAQQQTELDALNATHAEASAALGRARRELSLRRGSLDGVDREGMQKRALAHEQGRVQEAAVAKAEHALSAALCSLAEAADAVGLAHAASEQVAGLRASEKALDDVVDQLARYDRALTVYDRAALLRGALMWLGLLVVVAILVRVW